jgi:hypothetical protein
MKSAVIVTVLLIIVLILLIPFSGGTPDNRSLDITSLTIDFDRTNAIFTVNYDMGGLPKSVFSDFDYDIIKMDAEKAVLKVRNISRLDKGYYLHDAKKLGEYIDTVYIYTPDSPRPREYSYINTTQYTFYRS